jgi:hypothetical protein
MTSKDLLEIGLLDYTGLAIDRLGEQQLCLKQDNEHSMKYTQQKEQQ